MLTAVLWIWEVKYQSYNSEPRLANSETKVLICICIKAMNVMLYVVNGGVSKRLKSVRVSGAC